MAAIKKVKVLNNTILIFYLMGDYEKLYFADNFGFYKCGDL